jgi:hypothetical protein
MWKCVAAVLAAAVFVPCHASDLAFQRDMSTVWEALWHQSGTATRLVRWEQDLKVRVFGVNASSHRQHTLQALREVAAEAGLKVIDVSDRADAAQQANVSIEITPDVMLDDDQPCETRLDFRTETSIESATLQMRAGEARRCAYHEAMHVLGVRGHPEGQTVLSYFGTQVEGLMPLDRAMLRGWYSPRTRGGMTPFEVLPILADELVASRPDQRQATQVRDRFLARTVAEMRAFADGSGDAPSIVKRCGKATDQGVRFGRTEMSYFLGVAYLEGAAVARDSTQALRWLQRAADQGSRSAQTRLGAAGVIVASNTR